MLTMTLAFCAQTPLEETAAVTEVCSTQADRSSPTRSAPTDSIDRQTIKTQTTNKNDYLFLIKMKLSFVRISNHHFRRIVFELTRTAIFATLITKQTQHFCPNQYQPDVLNVMTKWCIGIVAVVDHVRHRIALRRREQRYSHNKKQKQEIKNQVSFERKHWNNHSVKNLKTWISAH